MAACCWMAALMGTNAVQTVMVGSIIPDLRMACIVLPTTTCHMISATVSKARTRWPHRRMVSATVSNARTQCPHRRMVSAIVSRVRTHGLCRWHVANVYSMCNEQWRGWSQGQCLVCRRHASAHIRRLALKGQNKIYQVID